MEEKKMEKVMENEIWTAVVTENAPGGKERNIMAIEAAQAVLFDWALSCNILKVPDIYRAIEHVIEEKYNHFPEEALEGLTVPEAKSKMLEDLEATITELNIETYED